MIFISYSHADVEFVEHLSHRLLNENIKVWRDEYKLSPGDSLSSSIQKAIDQASLLCIVISKSSLESQWVQKETNAGFLREGLAGQFSIVPLLIEDVERPAIIQDRLWIDFRKGFDEGISHLLNVIRRISPTDGISGSVQDANYFIYYATEEGWVGGLYDLIFDIVSFDREERFCILTRIQFRGNEAATEAGLRDHCIPSAKEYLLRACVQEFEANPARVEIRAEKPVRGNFHIESEDGEVQFDARFELKMLGSHRGETTVFNFGALFGQISTGAELHI